jgi:hypothetical protein
MEDNHNIIVCAVPGCGVRGKFSEMVRHMVASHAKPIDGGVGDLPAVDASRLAAMLEEGKKAIEERARTEAELKEAAEKKAREDEIGGRLPEEQAMRVCCAAGCDFTANAMTEWAMEMDEHVSEKHAGDAVTTEGWRKSMAKLASMAFMKPHRMGAGGDARSGGRHDAAGNRDQFRDRRDAGGARPREDNDARRRREDRDEEGIGGSGAPKDNFVIVFRDARIPTAMRDDTAVRAAEWFRAVDKIVRTTEWVENNTLAEHQCLFEAVEPFMKASRMTFDSVMGRMTRKFTFSELNILSGFAEVAFDAATDSPSWRRSGAASVVKKRGRTDDDDYRRDDDDDGGDGEFTSAQLRMMDVNFGDIKRLESTALIAGNKKGICLIGGYGRPLHYSTEASPKAESALAARLGRVLDFRVFASTKAMDEWMGRITDKRRMLANFNSIEKALQTGRHVTLLDYAHAHSLMVAKKPSFTIESVKDAFASMQDVYKTMYGSDHALAADFRRMATEGTLEAWNDRMMKALAPSSGGEYNLPDDKRRDIAASTVLRHFDVKMTEWQDAAYIPLARQFRIDSEKVYEMKRGEATAAIRYGEEVALPRFFEGYIQNCYPTIPMEVVVAQALSAARSAHSGGNSGKKEWHGGGNSTSKVKPGDASTPIPARQVTVSLGHQAAGGKTGGSDKSGGHSKDSSVGDDLPSWYTRMREEDLSESYPRAVFGRSEFSDARGATVQGKHWCIFHVIKKEGCNRKECWDERFHQNKDASVVKAATAPKFD